MTYNKHSLRAAVIKLFEEECNLDNYEFAALLDMFEAYRELKAEHAEHVNLCTARRCGLIGVIDFLMAAQHITPEQATELAKLVDSIRLVPAEPETDEATQAALDEIRKER